MISPVTLCRAIAKAKATVLYCVPSLVLREIKSHELGWAELGNSALRHVVFAGEPIDHQALRRFRPYVPEIALHNWYGPTETNVCCYHRITDADIAGDGRDPHRQSLPLCAAHLSLGRAARRQVPRPANCWWPETR